jgi:RNA polymerase sigma-70 factor (ECF subfamily)
MSVGERALVERAREGDDRAFAALFDAWQGPISGYLLRLTGDREAANDLTQETFLRAYRALGSLERSGADAAHTRAWLYRIATNQAHSWRRRQRLLHWLPFGPSTPEPAVDGPDHSLGERDLVERALRTVGTSHAAILLLRHHQHLSLDETAAVLDISPNTAKVRLYRARKAFVAAYTALTNPSTIDIAEERR